jgi:hypothetical protein
MGILKCIVCDFTNDSEIGLKRHYTVKHGGYDDEQLRQSGVSQDNDVARTLDSGRSSIDDVRSQAPEGESAEPVKGTAKTSSAKSKKSGDSEERKRFLELRPLLVSKWKRRLRIPYGVFAKLLGDPEIALTEQDAEDGANLHVDLMDAMGWYQAGKLEAVADVCVWHGATILSRSKIGKQLFAEAEAIEEETETPIPEAIPPQ